MRKRLRDSLVPEVVLWWLFFASRLVDILILPAYNDEAATIQFSRYIPQGQLSWVLTLLLRRDGKMLWPIVMRLFAPNGPESLWVLRAVTAVLLMLTFVSTMTLGRMLVSRTAGRLAGLFYIVSAMTFFNERQAWADNLMAAFSALAMVLTVMMIQTRRARYVLPLALTMLAATLSKVTGALVLGVPLAGVLVLTTDKQARWRTLLFASASVALVLGIMAALYALGGPLESPPEANQEQPFSRVVGALLGNACKVSTLCEGTSGVLAGIRPNFAISHVYGGWMWFLFGPPLVILVLGSLAWLGSRDWWRVVGFLWLVMLGRTIPLVSISGWISIRNFLYLPVPMIVLAALALVGLWRLPWRTRDTIKPALRTGYTAGVILLGLGAAFWTAPLDLAFVDEPQEVVVPPLHPYNCLYRDHFAFAYGYPEASQTLSDWMEVDPRPINVIAGHDRYIIPYWGPRLGDIEEWGKPHVTHVNVALWLIEDESVFFIDEVPARSLPDEPFGARTETVALHDIPCGEGVAIRVRRLVESGPEVQHAIYEAVFPNPNDEAEQYRAVATHLIDTGAEGAVVVYPPNQFDLLNSRLQWGTQLGGVYVVGDTWPLDPHEVEQSLGELAAEHGQLHVVLLEEDRGDPTHAIENWLSANMELVSEHWFGPVRLLSYK
jgi:hypothetical protein